MAPSPQNLVLVTVDCLRADHLGAYGHPRSPSPFLDRLAGESWVFERAITAGLPTYYAFPAILASRSPFAFGRDLVGLVPGEPTLAQQLQASGFRTAGFSAGNPYLSTREQYHQGFDVFRDFLGEDQGSAPNPSSEPKLRHRLHQWIARQAKRSNRSERLYREALFQFWALRQTRRSLTARQLRSYPAADQVVDAVLPWLREQEKRPFFLWLHLMDPHHPYYPPSQALELRGRSDLTPGRALYLNALWGREDLPLRRLERHRDDVKALYEAGIRWVDHQVERLVDALTKQDQWSETLFVLTADHGEEFLEHGGRYHYPVQMGDELSRVPLLVRDPARGSGRVVPPFSLLDLAPSLLARFGLEPPDGFQGQAHWTEAYEGTPSSAVTECIYDRRNPWQPGAESGARLMATQDQQSKLVVTFATGAEELFDLGGDPEEQDPRAAAENSDAGPLYRAMAQHLHLQRPDPSHGSWTRAVTRRWVRELRRRKQAPSQTL